MLFHMDLVLVNFCSILKFFFQLAFRNTYSGDWVSMVVGTPTENTYQLTNKFLGLPNNLTKAYQQQQIKVLILKMKVLIINLLSKFQQNYLITPPSTEPFQTLIPEVRQKLVQKKIQAILKHMLFIENNKDLQIQNVKDSEYKVFEQLQ